MVLLISDLNSHFSHYATFVLLIIFTLLKDITVSFTFHIILIIYSSEHVESIQILKTLLMHMINYYFGILGFFF